MKSHVSSGLCSYSLGSQLAFRSLSRRHIRVFAGLSRIRPCGQSAFRIAANTSMTCCGAPPGNLRQEWKITGERRKFRAPLSTRAAFLIERPRSCQPPCKNCPQHQGPHQTDPQMATCHHAQAGCLDGSPSFRKDYPRVVITWHKISCCLCNRQQN